MIKKNLALIIIILTFISCEDCKKDFSEINNLWLLISSDSVYYEYYFDSYQQFLFDEECSLAFQVSNHNDSLYKKLKNEMLTNESLKDDSCSIVNYISKRVIKNKTFITVKPIGSLCYRFSNDNNLNYILFSNESYIRFRLFKGLEIGYLSYPFRVYGIDRRYIKDIKIDTLIMYNGTKIVKEPEYHIHPLPAEN